MVGLAKLVNLVGGWWMAGMLWLVDGGVSSARCWWWVDGGRRLLAGVGVFFFLFVSAKTRIAGVLATVVRSRQPMVSLGWKRFAVRGAHLLAGPRSDYLKPVSWQAPPTSVRGVTAGI